MPCTACLPVHFWRRLHLPRLRLDYTVLRACAAIEHWDEAEGAGAGAQGAKAAKASLKIVLITGFESFNVDLYKKAAVQLARVCPGVSLRVFSDRDLGETREGCRVVPCGASQRTSH